MEDSASINANIGTLPIPSQIHLPATVLFNILNSDRESNAAILEKLENPQDDLNTSPIQVFSAGDLAHLASHVATNCVEETLVLSFGPMRTMFTKQADEDLTIA